MSVIFFDPIDQYGGNRSLLLSGVYSSIEGVTISTANPRTGTSCLRISALENDSGLRWRPPVSTALLGVGHALNITELPTNSTSAGLSQILDENGAVLATITLMPTGAIQARLGGRQGSVVGQSAAEALLPGGYQHFEIEWNDGAVEVRIDKVTVLNVPSVGYTGLIGQIMVAGCYGYPKTGALGVYYDIDDLYFRNGDGTLNNSWLGDIKAYMQVVNADGTPAEWVPSVGSEMWPMVDNIPPQDNAQYIMAEGPDKRAVLGYAAFPSQIISITAVQVMSRMWKTDAGGAKVAVGMISDMMEEAKPEHPISSAPRYYRDVFETDPATGLPWLLPAVNAADIVLDRTE